MNKKIIICGIGPGNPDLILPKVYAEIKKADMIIGGERHLQIFSNVASDADEYVLKFDKLGENIDDDRYSRIVVLVSGDTGFHSLRDYFNRNY